jgi:hypothetical protein
MAAKYQGLPMSWVTRRITVNNQGCLKFVTRRAVAALALLASLAGIGTASAHTASVTVTSNPTSVSVSPAGRPTFYVEYTVSVTNQSSRNSYDYDFKGKTLVSGAAAPVPTATLYSSSGVSCTTSADPTLIACTRTKIGPNQTKTFKVTFKTPSAGTNLRFTLTALSGGRKYGEGYVNTELITLPEEQSIVSFNTLVPTSGGTFFTGFKGAGASPPPGGVATTEDPWTTTVVVPGIVNATTANASETIPPAGSVPPGSICLPGNYVYVSCFATTLTIPGLVYPSGSATPYITIYVRIDYLQVGGVGDIATAPLWYEKTPGSGYIQLVACGAAGPSPGTPCIANRKVYAYNDPNIEFRNDWEFEVHAVDNGRYIN